MSPKNKSIHDESGQSLVEAALSLSVLLMMVFGVITGALMLYTYHYLSYAARIGSRYAIVRGSACDASNGMPDCPSVTSDQVQTYVRSIHYAGIDAAQTSITVTWPSGNTPGNPVNVTAQYPFPFTVPFMNATTYTLHSSSQMIISQ